MEWLSHSKKKYCELCKTPFRFTKLYDTSMPTVLPWHTFARQLALHFAWTALRWVRYLAVIVIWLVALPWCIRQVWRGLFWLADGSQMGTRHSPPEINTTNATQMNESTTTDANVSGSLFASVLNFLSSDSISAKIVRALLSMPVMSTDPPAEDQVIPTARPSELRRQPSLLSGTSFVTSWTGSTLANNVSIDIMEGILISLGLVASFILVFLIREWVINQQPMLNNPEPVEGDANVALLEEARQQRAIRRARRRRPNTPAEVPPQAIDAAADENSPLAPEEASSVSPPEEPQPRRAMTDDNILVSSTFGVPDIPVRAQSLVPPTGSPGDPSHAVPEPTEYEADFAPTLVRGMVGDAVDALRELEETGNRPQTESPTSDTAQSSPTLGSSPLVISPQDYETSNDHTQNAMQEDTAFDAARLQLPTPPPEESEAAESSRTPRPSKLSVSDEVMPGLVPEAAEIAEHPQLPNILPSSSVDEEQGIPSLGENENASMIANPSTSEADAVDSNDDTQAVEEPKTLLGKVFGWLWFVDDVPDPELHQDLPHEAPLPPDYETHDHAAGNAAPAGHHAHAADAEAPRPIQLFPDQAMVDAGIDPDNPNAFEDAEELEGVLEMIGMEGPLIGMVQNVVFSLLLISLTLSAAVWIPYIWGKIALILLANPVAVTVKAPIYLVTHVVDLIADVCFFLLGLLGLVFNIIAKMVKQASKPLVPSYSQLIDTETFEALAINVTHRSGSRLERTLSDALTMFNPDLPTFSAQSHAALTTFKASLASSFSAVAHTVVRTVDVVQDTPLSLSSAFGGIKTAFRAIPQIPGYLTKVCLTIGRAVRSPTSLLASEDTPTPKPALSNAPWTAQDKIIAVVLGYALFVLAGAVFMKVAHAILGKKKNEKVEGPLADRLREAGGVLKVIVIIGIEMIMFPLYCGLLLDLALLPLFNGASIQTRLAFIAEAPFTGLFLHWFAGTCYMFHFALFVSMCRKILRKGVLYFIRDPDDPTFHPVRDVLERPVPTQLGKIAFSALVYGGLVIMCLGGVVWGIAQCTAVLPIRFGGTHPRLAFPIDVVLLNFLLPFLLRKMKPSEKISAAYEWWFRGIAHGLRLSNFLFGDEREDEKKPRIRNGILSWHRPGEEEKPAEPEAEGTYVRAPASDFCRIPRGQRAFLEVDETNKRVDGLPDHKRGLHGYDNKHFAKIWLPPQFKPRMATCVVLLWLFAAGTGIGCTIGPLILGRWVIESCFGSEGPVNDLYALTAGLHVMVAAGATIFYARPAYQWTHRKGQETLPAPKTVAVRILKTVQYLAGLSWLAITLGVVLPFTLSLITELYIHIPLFTFLFDREKIIASAPDTTDAQILAGATALNDTMTAPATSSKLPPTVYALQTWTLGILYLRIVLRIAANYPCPHARIPAALRMIYRNGWTRPDVRLATRALILPLMVLCIAVIGVPLGLAKLVILSSGTADQESRERVYRFAYPCMLLGLAHMYLLWKLKNRLLVWRTMVRDDVYLVGEKLHNYVSSGVELGAKKDKGKGKEKAKETGEVTAGRRGRSLSMVTDRDDASEIDMDVDVVDTEPPGLVAPGLVAEGSMARDW